MSALAVKICGLTDEAALRAAVAEGARYAGFVFYPPSPRHLTPEHFARLRAGLPPEVAAVGVFVDPSDEAIAQVLAAAPLDYVQLHGRESAERVVQVRRRFGVRVIKALPLAARADLAVVGAYRDVADMLLFDARPPKGAWLPGGNAARFDWHILQGFDPGLPWFLAGGLHAGNLAEAVRISGARQVDVSSGVEVRPGQKDPARIRTLLRLARTLAPAHLAGVIPEDGP